MSIKWGIDFQNGKPTGEVKEVYKGAVIATRERNYYDDSDFYAIVWDEETQSLKSIEYATTRFGGGGDATADATPEVLEKVREYLAPLIARSAIGDSQERYAKQVKEFKAFHTGTPVRVIRTIKSRKQGVIPEGFTGVLVWKGAPYRYGGFDRYGVKNPETGRCVFVESKDIEYAGPEPTDDDVMPPATLANDYDRVLEKVRDELKNAAAHRLGAFHASINPHPGLVVI